MCEYHIVSYSDRICLGICIPGGWFPTSESVASRTHISSRLGGLTASRDRPHGLVGLFISATLSFEPE